MKKIVSLLVVLVLASAFLMSSAFAAGDPQIVVSSVEAAGGEEIKLTVSLVNNPGFTNGKITVNYDESGLELIEIDTETQDMYENRIMAMTNGALMNFVATADVTADMEMFYIRFKVKEGASGDYRVGLTIDLMKNNAEEDVVFTVVEGIVSVKGAAGEVPGTQPGEDPTSPDQNPTNPGEDATNPGQDPGNPDAEPTNPGSVPTVPGGEPATNPSGEQNQQPDAPISVGVLVAVLAVLAAALGGVLVLLKKRKA
jgi:hypothetical protein